MREICTATRNAAPSVLSSTVGNLRRFHCYVRPDANPAAAAPAIGGYVALRWRLPRRRECFHLYRTIETATTRICYDRFRGLASHEGVGS